MQLLLKFSCTLPQAENSICHPFIWNLALSQLSEKKRVSYLPALNPFLLIRNNDNNDKTWDLHACYIPLQTKKTSYTIYSARHIWSKLMTHNMLRIFTKLLLKFAVKELSVTNYNILCFHGKIMSLNRNSLIFLEGVTFCSLSLITPCQVWDNFLRLKALKYTKDFFMKISRITWVIFFENPFLLTTNPILPIMFQFAWLKIGKNH